MHMWKSHLKQEPSILKSSPVLWNYPGAECKFTRMHPVFSPDKLAEKCGQNYNFIIIVVILQVFLCLAMIIIFLKIMVL